MPSDDPWREGLTTIGNSRRSSMAGERVRRAQLAERGLGEGDEVRAWGCPAAWRRCLVMTLSMAREQARTPDPVYGISRISRSSCTVPSSPSRPCRATKTTSGRSSRSRRIRSLPTSTDTTSWPSRVERVLHVGARAKRHLALQRAPSLEDGDPAHAPSARAPAVALAAQLDDPRPGLGVVLLARDLQLLGADRGHLAGERAVQLHLLGDDLADPADALADPLLAGGREVQPHRVVRRGRRGRRRRRARTPRCRAAPGPGGRWCR